MELTVFVAIGTLVVGAAALVLTRLDIRRERQRRIRYELAYERLLPKNLFGVLESWHLTIHLADGKIVDPRLIVMGFHNVGRVPLQKNDMPEPLRLEVVDGILRAVSAILVPKGSTVHSPLRGIRREGNRVAVSEILLNPGDSIVFYLLVDGGKEPPRYGLRANGFDIV